MANGLTPAQMVASLSIAAEMYNRRLTSFCGQDIDDLRMDGDVLHIKMHSGHAYEVKVTLVTAPKHPTLTPSANLGLDC